MRAKIELPVELRNEVSHLRVEGENSAGAVALLDARSKVKRVALVGGESADAAQPLLSPLYYLEKALAPFAQVRTARPGVVDPVQALLAEHPNIMGLADVGLAPGETLDALSRFVEEGGTLVRFAGPRLANADDDLLPVRLRRNGRVLGGAMSWEEPKSLAEFEAAGPFFGLPASKDVTVQRQVLAEPDPGLAGKTWARLSDGTPLVTAERRGKGLIVLFHVNADANWSNLPISGLFVEMLKRISAMAGNRRRPATNVPTFSPISRLWRRCAFSTDLARLARPVRPRKALRRTSKVQRAPNIRLAFTARERRSSRCRRCVLGRDHRLRFRRRRAEREHAAIGRAARSARAAVRLRFDCLYRRRADRPGARREVASAAFPRRDCRAAGAGVCGADV